MAYQTGSFTSPADLIATIKAFCSANGWTVSGDVISKGTIFTALTVESVVPEDMLKVQGGTGEAAGLLTGASSRAAYCLGSKYLDFGLASRLSWAATATYWIFFDAASDNVVCIMMANDGLHFNWLCFGKIEKYGSYAGSECFGASYSMTSESRIPGFAPDYASSNWWNLTDTLAPLWLPGSANSPPAANFVVRCDIESEVWLGESSYFNMANCGVAVNDLLKRSPNNWNNQTVLTPCWVFTARPSNFRSLIGLFAPARMVKVNNYKAGDIITLGADKYKVFPYFKKSTSVSNGYFGNSGNYGWAIKYDGP